MPHTTPDRRAAAGRLRRLLFASAAFLFVFAAQAQAGARQSAPGSFIVNAAGVRLRERPDAGSAEVARLQLGAVVQAQERTPEKSMVGTAEDFWYLVAAPGGGARGWVFGGLVAPFDPARREEIYRSLASERLARAGSNFAELSELVRFLGRATKEVTRRDALAELELSRLTALARSLASFSIENQEQAPYKAWTTEHEPEIVYSEPAGQWFVRAEQYWDFQKKYRDLPAAERAAWEAAQTPLPGECEGFLPCYFAVQSMTYGEYLTRYPRGPHAEAALAQIGEVLKQISDDLRGAKPVYEVARVDRPEFRKTAAALRAQIAGAASPKKSPVLAQLDAVMRRFR